MLFDEAVQNGNKVVVAVEGVAGGIHVLRGDLTVADNQLACETVAVAAVGICLIGGQHVVHVVDHGLGQHDGGLAGGQIDGHGAEGDTAVFCGGFSNKAVEVNQNVALLVKLIQNLFKFGYSNEVVLVLHLVLIVIVCPVGIHNQHLEGQVCDGGGLVPALELILQRGVLSALVNHFLILFHICCIGEAVQLIHGTLVVITGSQQGSFLQQTLRLHLQAGLFAFCIFSISKCLIAIVDGILYHTANAAENEEQTQNCGQTGDDGRQVNFLDHPLPAQGLPAGIYGQLGHFFFLGRFCFCRNFLSGSFFRRCGNDNVVVFLCGFCNFGNFFGIIFKCALINDGFIKIGQIESGLGVLGSLGLGFRFLFQCFGEFFAESSGKASIEFFVKLGIKILNEGLIKAGIEAGLHFFFIFKLRIQNGVGIEAVFFFKIKVLIKGIFLGHNISLPFYGIVKNILASFDRKSKIKYKKYVN